MRMIFPSKQVKLPISNYVTPTRYRNPNDLAVTPAALRRVLVVGSCLAAGFAEGTERFEEGCPSDYVLFNNFAELPASPPNPIDAYDFQLVQVPLRSVLPDYTYFRIPFDDIGEFQRLFDSCCERLLQLLDAALQWSRASGLLTFVTNFMLPQQNPMGRLLPRNDLRNFVHFVDRLNAVIADEAAARTNVHVLDVDQIAATLGRKYFQDDVLLQLNHAAALTDYDHALDQGRIEPPQPASSHYELRTDEYIRAWWSEVVASYRTIRQIDTVKLVVVDLDDTLWRGVVIEEGNVTVDATEGWPLGFVEALTFLKRRGVLLAIVSKNDEAKVAAVWEQMLQGRLDLSDFAVRKINWRPKVENLAEVLDVVNVLPRNTVFIDDNPVERAAIAAAYPEVRVLGAELYCLRRVLLWSAETQVATISGESSRRTQMVQAQVERENTRKRLSRDEFLRTLELQVRMFAIRNAGDKRFARAFELLNKTNQFNSTGKRWTHAEAVSFFSGGGVFHAFEVADRFTQYGLVGVALVSANAGIEQFVMSCRVIGLDVETAAIAEIGRDLARQGHRQVTAKLIETDANQPVRDLFPRCGMRRDGADSFAAELSALGPVPGHVSLM